MFLYPDNRHFSRNYNSEEKETPFFQDVQRLMCRKDCFRDWEYPAVLAALGVEPGLTYLCIGGFGDALAIWLSHVVSLLHVVDRVGHEAVRDYPLSYGQYWNQETDFITGDWCEIANHCNQYDRIFSVGSVEHNLTARDVLFMWQVGQHLRPGGRAVITTEWGEQYAYDADMPPPRNVVGGHIYDNAAIQQRLVMPSGLRMTEWQENPIDWSAIEQEAPFIGRSIVRFMPALIVLDKHG